MAVALAWLMFKAMNKLFDKALARLRELPDDRREALAALILEELDDDEGWEASFANSGAAIDRLAAEARVEHAEGNTRPLDPDKMG